MTIEWTDGFEAVLSYADLVNFGYIDIATPDQSTIDTSVVRNGSRSMKLRVGASTGNDAQIRRVVVDTNNPVIGFGFYTEHDAAAMAMVEFGIDSGSYTKHIVIERNANDGISVFRDQRSKESTTGTDIVFTEITNIISSTSTDLSVFDDGDHIGVSGSALNNTPITEGVDFYTVTGTPTTNSMTVVEELVEEAAGASVILVSGGLLLASSADNVIVKDAWQFIEINLVIDKDEDIASGHTDDTAGSGVKLRDETATFISDGVLARYRAILLSEPQTRDIIQVVSETFIATNDLGKDVDGEDLSWKDKDYEIYRPTRGSIIVKISDSEVVNASFIETQNGDSNEINRVNFVSFESQVADNTKSQYYDDIYLANGHGIINNDTIGDTQSIVLRPNGSSPATAWEVFGAALNYQAVDEVFRDDDTSYVFADLFDQKDCYAFEDLTDHFPEITSVTVNTFAKIESTGNGQYRHSVRIGGDEIQGPIHIATTSYTLASTTFNEKPGGGQWNNCDVNLAEMGIIRFENERQPIIRVTQIYVQITTRSVIDLTWLCVE